LLGLQGRRQNYPGGCVRSRLSAASRGAHRGLAPDSRQNDARALAGETRGTGRAGDGSRITMDAQEIYGSLEKLFPGKVSDLKAEVFDPYLTVLDWPKEEKIQVVYHLFSYAYNHQIVLKVDLPRDNPKVATVENVWKV